MWDGRLKQPAIYFLASAPNGALYTGVTSALYDRMIEHRHGVFEGFTKKYGIKILVYFEPFDTMAEGIQREKRLKKWNRLWKLRLIEQLNPTWAELFDPEHGVREVGPGGQRRTE